MKSPIFVKLTERGAKYKMTNGCEGALYEVYNATRTASGFGLSVQVITNRHSSDFKDVKTCVLGPNGDYELTKSEDYDRLIELAVDAENNFIQNFYANESLYAEYEDDRDPTEFERSVRHD